MMIVFLGRDRISYFQSYKNYFQAIYLVFLGFPVAYLLEGITQPSAPVGSFLLGLGAVVVVIFTLYPLAIISRRRALVKDRDVRAALRIIASVFGVISATLILGIAVSSFGYGIIGST